MFSAYDLKKIIPRAIFALVAVNLSWSLMTILVNLITFLGDSIQGIIIGSFPAELRGVSLGGNDGLTLAAIAAIGGAAAIGGLIPVAGVAAAGALGVLLAFGIILLRRVALVGLVVIAPIAIALSVFPQTEKLAKQWWEWFFKLLLMYPFIMGFFGISEIAAGIISSLDGPIYALAAVAILIIPYFVVGKAFSFAGGTIGRLAGMVNNKDKGLIDRTKKWDHNRVAENRAKTKAGTRYSDKFGTRTINRVGGLAFNRGSRARAEDSFQARKAQIKETHKSMENLSGDEARLLAESQGSESKLTDAIERMTQEAYESELQKVQEAKARGENYAARSLSELRTETKAKARTAKAKAGGRIDAGVAATALDIAVGKGSITDGAQIEKLASATAQTALGVGGSGVGATMGVDAKGAAIGAAQQKLVEQTTAINQAEQAGNFEMADMLREQAGLAYTLMPDGSTRQTVTNKGTAATLKALGNSYVPGENKSDLGARSPESWSAAGRSATRPGMPEDPETTAVVNVPPSSGGPVVAPPSGGAFSIGQKVVHTQTNASGVVTAYTADGRPVVNWDTASGPESGPTSAGKDNKLRPM